MADEVAKGEVFAEHFLVIAEGVVFLEVGKGFSAFEEGSETVTSCDSGSSAVVCDSFWDVGRLVACFVKAPGEVDVFFVHEEADVEGFAVYFDLVEGGSSINWTCAGDSPDFCYLVVLVFVRFALAAVCCAG